MTGSAWALFVKPRKAQGEWCSQNPSEVRVLTWSFALNPKVLHKQRPSSPVIIPIITRNSQILEISNENCAAQLSLILASRPSCSWKSIEDGHSLRKCNCMDGIELGT